MRKNSLPVSFVSVCLEAIYCLSKLTRLTPTYSLVGRIPMRCVHCGRVNADDIIICRFCGGQISDSRHERVPSSFLSPADSSLPMHASHQDSSRSVISYSIPRARRRRRRSLGWAILALFLLVAVAGLALLIANAPQSSASVSQVLLTYCDAMKRGDYQQAYEQWTSSYKQQLTEADFAYYYQSRAKVTTCVVSNVSQGSSSATGTISLSFANGSIETNEMQLIMENNTWKIHGQTSP